MASDRSLSIHQAGREWPSHEIQDEESRHTDGCKGFELMHKLSFGSVTGRVPDHSESVVVWVKLMI